MTQGLALNEAFANALTSLDPHVSDEEDAFEMLSNSFKEHSKAINLFSYHLKGNEKNNFNDAWLEYYCLDGDKNFPSLEQYSSHIGSHELYVESCALGVQRINKILSYANT